MLETYYEVISVSDDDDLPGGVSLTPPVNPEVQCVVQEHVGEQRRNHCPLGRSHFRSGPLSVLGDSRPQPFADQAEYPSVGNPVLEELYQPSVGDGIEKPLDVGIQHPVHLPSPDSLVECIQRVVLVSSRSETIGEAQEVHLVDLVEHRDDRQLDDLILQGGDAERSLSPVGLCNVGPSGWLGSVGAKSQIL
jgi:hypothetical protein